MSSDNTIKAGKMIGFRVSDDAMARAISFSLSRNKQGKVSEWVRECIRLRLAIERSGLSIEDVNRPGFFAGLNSQNDFSKNDYHREQSSDALLMTNDQVLHLVNKLHETFAFTKQISYELSIDPNFSGSNQSKEKLKEARDNYVKILDKQYEDKG